MQTGCWCDEKFVLGFLQASRLSNVHMSGVKLNILDWILFYIEFFFFFSCRDICVTPIEIFKINLWIISFNWFFNKIFRMIHKKSIGLPNASWNRKRLLWVCLIIAYAYLAIRLHAQHVMSFVRIFLCYAIHKFWKQNDAEKAIVENI